LRRPDDAPGATWEYTFTHAQLGAPVPFVSVPGSSIFFSQGLGNAPKAVKQPKKKKKGHGPGVPPVQITPTPPPPPPPAH
jgi:hypothetical protein